VIRLRISDLRAETDALSAQLEVRREQLHRLMPCVAERRWPAPWPAAALLDDPEAAIDLPEALQAETAVQTPRYKIACVETSLSSLKRRSLTNAAGD
jgi:hypothetical protein